MSDRIDELVAAVRGGYPWQEYPAKSESYIALTELATIAREAERDVATLKDAYDEKCHAYTLLREATLSVEDEADKWCNVAEWLANQLVTAKVRWPVLVGAWSLPPRAEDVWLEAALAAVEQEEAE